MAVFCLALGREDLRRRLGAMIVGYTRERKPVRAADLKADGALAALLKDAIQPNLVQTLEGNPAFIHGGPFANIAHGCNSAIATKAALKLADYVVTEAGFGADLGAEKFFDIKCRKAGLKPDAAVVVATLRALKMHGGVPREELGRENLGAVEKGLANLGRHLGNVAQFGVPAVVAVNRFDADTTAEFEVVQRYCAELGVEAFSCSHWSHGGRGTEGLAAKVAEVADRGAAEFRTLYPDDMPLLEKLRTIARKLYGAEDVAAESRAGEQFEQFEAGGFGRFPICVAKTQYSFTTDPSRKGAPSGHLIPVRELRLAAGAEFVVAICGDIMTMPGLPRRPSAEAIGVDVAGRISGLF
jgi:formate--tetrahydrofolate ligase